MANLSAAYRPVSDELSRVVKNPTAVGHIIKTYYSDILKKNASSRRNGTNCQKEGGDSNPSILLGLPSAFPVAAASPLK